VRSVDTAKAGLQIVRCSFLFLIVAENGDGFDGGSCLLLNQTVEAPELMIRNTTQRNAIQDVFLRKDRPLRVEEILQTGSERVESLNQATVYRNLKLLVASGWLRTVKHPKLGILYERTGKAHHHYFHCRSCNNLFDLPGCALNEKDATPPGFITEAHEVFLSGLCSGCGS
jgi:Fur family ferric uptake transcriptional regulator